MAQMSAEVRDDNPYSRLMALERMGVVDNYQAITSKSVAIIGVGGVGSVVAEMLTRCGIGKLILFDYDKVELANMNRLFFRPEQRGMTKVDAARQTLHNINPDVEFECCDYNITVAEHYDKFLQTLAQGGKSGGPIDLLLCCVDNFTARLTVNQACLELQQPWMESGVAENAVSGHIQLLLPGVTPCYQCCPPLVVASGLPEAKRVGVCAASLPTTMGIVAGFLSQNTLKYLLKFGTVSEYVGYDAMQDHFPSIVLKPNPECTSGHCVALQREYAAKVQQLGPLAHPLYKPPPPKKQVKRTENEWGITIEGGGDDTAGASAPAGGLQYAYAAAAASAGPAEHEFVQPTGESIEALMAKLKVSQN
jgi:ubiquitin-like modifier-activating enzyme 5